MPRRCHSCSSCTLARPPARPLDCLPAPTWQQWAPAIARRPRPRRHHIVHTNAHWHPRRPVPNAAHPCSTWRGAGSRALGWVLRMPEADATGWRAGPHRTSTQGASNTAHHAPGGSSSRSGSPPCSPRPLPLASPPPSLRSPPAAVDASAALLAGLPRATAPPSCCLHTVRGVRGFEVGGQGRVAAARSHAQNTQLASLPPQSAPPTGSHRLSPTSVWSPAAACRGSRQAPWGPQW